MTFRRYIPKIHLHPLLLIFIVLSFFTGTFMELSIILLIVFIHELGHYTVARFFKWRIHYIVLWVFGGVMETEEHSNKRMIEDLLVTIAGPFQHVLLYGLFYLFAVTGFVSSPVLELLFFYNTVILLFNLLPIWPLDGGKVLFILLSILFPYRKAYYSVIIFSIVTSACLLLFQLFVFPFNLGTFFIMIFLLMENRTEWKRRFYVFIRFLLSRYEGNSAVSGIYPIVVPSSSSLMDVFNYFRQDKKHSIYVTYPNDRRLVLDESDCLRSYFYAKQYDKTIGEIAKEIS